MKLNKFIENLIKIQNKYPQSKDWNVIYSSDDEGNNYFNVKYDLSLTQVHDLDERYLEIVGLLGDNNIDIRDINCVIIN